MGLRIPVWLLVEARHQGVTEAAILEGYPFLHQADLDAAWAYERAHPDEISSLMLLNEVV